MPGTRKWKYWEKIENQKIKLKILQITSKKMNLKSNDISK